MYSYITCNLPPAWGKIIREYKKRNKDKNLVSFDTIAKPNQEDFLAFLDILGDFSYSKRDTIRAKVKKAELNRIIAKYSSIKEIPTRAVNNTNMVLYCLYNTIIKERLNEKE